MIYFCTTKNSYFWLVGWLCLWHIKLCKLSNAKSSLSLSHIYIYIYIYIYICYPQTDCFVVSQFFSVVRHAGRFKLGSKPV